MKLLILNSRQVKKIRQAIEKDFGCFFTKDYAYLQNNQGKIFAVNKDIAHINTDNLRLDRVGLYVAQIDQFNSVRLSKEGSQLLLEQNPGKITQLVALTKEEVEIYFQGEKLQKELTLPDPSSIILTYNHEILGATRYKNKTILNYLPKVHRVNVIV